MIQILQTFPLRPRHFITTSAEKKNLLPLRREPLIPQQEMYEQCLHNGEKLFGKRKTPISRAQDKKSLRIAH